MNNRHSLPKFLICTLLLSLLTGCGGSSSSSSSGAAAEEVIEPNLTAAVVGPNLNGDTWSGYLKDRHGTFKRLTAVIRQEGQNIIIDTSLEDEPGDALRGTISPSGKMLLYDDFDNQDWTTLFGPASVNSINIADFVFVGGQRVDTNIIILKRQ